MDPTAQNTPTQPVDSSQSVVATPAPTQVTQASQQPVSVPLGGKEQEVVTVAEVQPTHKEVVVPEVVKEAGVENTPSEEPQLTDEHQGLVEAAKETTPVPHGPSIVQLPDEYKAPKGFFSLLHQHVRNAATWLYLLLFKSKQQSMRQDQATNKI